MHQHIIARLTAKLYPFYEAGAIAYEPLPEMMVGEYNSPVPDVILGNGSQATESSLSEVLQ